MTKINAHFATESFTYGVELEIADVNTNISLPSGNSWDKKDYTIANSCGVCNDPAKKLTIFGGEINTKPTNSIEDQVDNIENIFNVLGSKKSINHTCNMHIHVGVEGLREDLEALKKLASYIFKYQEEAFNIVEVIPEPKATDYDTKEEFDGAKKRFNRRKVSHQRKLSKLVLDKMLVATSIDEFFEAFAPKGEDGTVYWGTVTRCGINMLQMYKETGTVEFRHFPMTFDLLEIESSITWCKEFMNAALNTGESPSDFYARHHDWMKFPEFVKYDHKIQTIMEQTSVGKVSRAEAEKNINYLLEKGIIKKADLFEDGHDGYDVVFICHGNVNRSKMAEFYMKKISPSLNISSFAAGVKSRDGVRITKKTRDLLTKYGIVFDPETRSKVITPEIVRSSKLVFVMDGNNIKHYEAKYGSDGLGKLILLPSVIGEHKIKDPGFTKGIEEFERALISIVKCCNEIKVKYEI